MNLDKALRRIYKHYKSSDHLFIYNEAASFRVGTKHEELVNFGTPRCPICGPVDNLKIDPVCHPEFFMDESEGRCPHGAFLSGAGACSKCGRKAEL